MDNLLNKKCIPCEGGVPPLSHDESMKLMDQISGWNLIEEKSENLRKTGIGSKIAKEYKFKDFIDAMNFVKKVAEIAENEGHHPDIYINYNKVLLEHSTHAIGGLSENDFILATKIDNLL